MTSDQHLTTLVQASPAAQRLCQLGGDPVPILTGHHCNTGGVHILVVRRLHV